MTQALRVPRLQPSAKAIWRKAADELLIDAIFGRGPAVRRDAGHERLVPLVVPRNPHANG